MSALVVLGVGVLGGLGAVARVLLAGAVDRGHATAFPLGILAVNVLGSFAAGVLAGLVVDEDTSRLLATGLLGALTTFSTWMLDSARLGPRLRVANLVGSLVLGLAAVWLGRELGSLL